MLYSTFIAIFVIAFTNAQPGGSIDWGSLGQTSNITETCVNECEIDDNCCDAPPCADMQCTTPEDLNSLLGGVDISWGASCNVCTRKLDLPSTNGTNITACTDECAMDNDCCEDPAIPCDQQCLILSVLGGCNTCVITTIATREPNPCPDGCQSKLDCYSLDPSANVADLTLMACANIDNSTGCGECVEVTMDTTAAAMDTTEAAADTTEAAPEETGADTTDAAEATEGTDTEETGAEATDADPTDAEVTDEADEPATEEPMTTSNSTDEDPGRGPGDQGPADRTPFSAGYRYGVMVGFGFVIAMLSWM